jgi:hypothetical protein
MNLQSNRTKKNLVLFISKAIYPGNGTIAPTLAWLAATKGHFFDLYYDSHHLGLHFQGGDWRTLETGQLTGGTVSGGRHFQEFYFLLQNFNVTVVTTGQSLLLQAANNSSIPIRACSEKVNVLYRNVFQSFDTALPREIVMIGGDFAPGLAGLEAYFYPEIYYRRALGVSETIPDQELEDLCGGRRKIVCVCVRQSKLDQLSKAGHDVEVVDSIFDNDSYCSITGRLASRWKDKAKGWIIGDPTLIAHWIPTACEQDLLSIYSVPQGKILLELKSLISSTSNVVYGRQYEDTDFFNLSTMDQALQVIDPCRPQFQTVRHVDYQWDEKNTDEGPFADEYSDAELKQFAAEGRILVSLIFWTGMVREVENFHALMDLVAITGLKCGMAITAQTYEYMMHAPFELLSVPTAQGGVCPLVEPLLGSCGVGVGIEESMTADRLEEDLIQAMQRIRARVKQDAYVPKGWWPTMDTRLEARRWFEKPHRINLKRYSPYLKIRFHLTGTDGSGVSHSDSGDGFLDRAVKSVKSTIRKSRFMRHFEPYRPYEFYKPGKDVNQKIIEAVKAAGLQYMFTKAAFDPKPTVPYIDKSFIALNYTAGQWDGWTPFETINDLTDLKKAERRLIRTGKPGWIVSTIDSCLWTFSGEFWKRGSRLGEIASYCAQGGQSGKLINAKPITVSRYARIISEARIRS